MKKERAIWGNNGHGHRDVLNIAGQNIVIMREARRQGHSSGCVMHIDASKPGLR